MNSFRNDTHAQVGHFSRRGGAAAVAGWLLVVAVLLMGGVTAVQVLAQDDEDGTVWEAPVNLSNSGSAADPLVVRDRSGQYHLLWQDAFAGFVYRTGDGRTWAEPVAARLPFSQPSFGLPTEEDFGLFFRPALAPDDNDRIHAFWVDGDGFLLYRRNLIEEFTSINGWTAEARLSGSASAVDATVDGEGRLHLVYIRPRPAADIAAGVYHRISENSGQSWLDPVLLYASPYFAVAGSEEANIQMVVDDNGGLHLVWDNPALEKIFYTRSNDGGQTWADPFIVDQREPEDDPAAVGPAQIDIAVMGPEVHLTWRAGLSADQCGQFHRWSGNGGESWPTEPELVIDDSGECPTFGELFFGEDELVFLLTTIRGEHNLQAWDHISWSDPESTLAPFIDPQTNRPVSLRCLMPVVQANALLTVFGCGEGATSDVWALTRPLGNITTWSTRFQPTPVWQEPVEVISRSEPFDTIEMAYAGDGQIHAFWSQADEESVMSDSAIPRAIFYSRLQAGVWTPPRPIIEANRGKANQPAVTHDGQGNLLLVWSGGASGQIFFSRAVAERAISITEWSEPLPLPSIRAAGAWPDILVDGRGNTIYVAYSIPLNEGRGIYLTQSDDGGENWSPPVQVFDGTAAGWEMVGQPQLAVTRSGSLHLMWSEMSQPGGVGSLSLVYARSDDMGQTWSEPAVVSDEPATWSQIIGQNEQVLHRVWLGRDEGRVELFHQYSEDNGLTWERPDSVFDLNVQVGPTTMVAGIDTLFLIQLSRRLTDNEQLLQQWQWDGDRWRLIETLQLGSVLNANVVSGVAASNGNLSVLYGYLAFDLESEQLLSRLRHTNRNWEVPQVTATPLPTLTPTPVPQPTATPTPVPLPTATATLVATAIEDTGSLTGFSPIIISVALAVLLVGVVFAFGVRAVRRR